jgi:predicted dinucleotide-utilizing enzyme
MSKITRLGIVGTGFIARGLVMALDEHEDLVVSKVLTRTDIGKRTDFPRQDLLTNSIDELVEHSDFLVECIGDVIHATNVIDKVMAASPGQKINFDDVEIPESLALNAWRETQQMA